MVSGIRLLTTTEVACAICSDSSSSNHCEGLLLAGEPGFEPGLADPESAVLPLDDSPALS